MYALNPTLSHRPCCDVVDSELVAEAIFNSNDHSLHLVGICDYWAVILF